jgi:predicted NodU family carbamoyl transferase
MTKEGAKEPSAIIMLYFYAPFMVTTFWLNEVAKAEIPAVTVHGTSRPQIVDEE